MSLPIAQKNALKRSITTTFLLFLQFVKMRKTIDPAIFGSASRVLLQREFCMYSEDTYNDIDVFISSLFSTNDLQELICNLWTRFKTKFDGINEVDRLDLQIAPANKKYQGVSGYIQVFRARIVLKSNVPEVFDNVIQLIDFVVPSKPKQTIESLISQVALLNENVVLKPPMEVVTSSKFKKFYLDMWNISIIHGGAQMPKGTLKYTKRQFQLTQNILYKEMTFCFGPMSLGYFKTFYGFEEKEEGKTKVIDVYKAYERFVASNFTSIIKTCNQRNMSFLNLFRNYDDDDDDAECSEDEKEVLDCDCSNVDKSLNEFTVLNVFVAPKSQKIVVQLSSCTLKCLHGSDRFICLLFSHKYGRRLSLTNRYTSRSFPSKLVDEFVNCDTTKCAICQDMVTFTKAVTPFGCGLCMFHKGCADDWMLEKNNCPNCRK
jgi:hypothetical protein